MDKNIANLEKLHRALKRTAEKMFRDKPDYSEKEKKALVLLGQNIGVHADAIVRRYS